MTNTLRQRLVRTGSTEVGLVRIERADQPVQLSDGADDVEEAVEATELAVPEAAHGVPGHPGTLGDLLC